jgi:hypothetical protein
MLARASSEQAWEPNGILESKVLLKNAHRTRSFHSFIAAKVTPLHP